MTSQYAKDRKAARIAQREVEHLKRLAWGNAVCHKCNRSRFSHLAVERHPSAVPGETEYVCPAYFACDDDFGWVDD